MRRTLATLVLCLCAAGSPAHAGAQIPAPTPKTPTPLPTPVSPGRPATSPPGSVVPLPGGVPTNVELDRVVAVVGDQPILWSEVLEFLNQRRAQGLQMPSDSAGQMELARQTVNELADAEILVQQAKGLKVEVTDEEVSKSVEQQIAQVRKQFKTDQEYRTQLKAAGFGTPEEYRRSLVEQARRGAIQQRVMEKFREEGKLLPASVTEAEVTEAFEKNKGTLPRRPATVTFRQIIVAPKASPKEKRAALAKAESLLVEIRKGGDFEQIAKRESMDEQSRSTGGDLGWNRRGVMVPQFERVMFSLPPGQVSSVFETSFGYHILRVDRVQPAEVKARHILIRPKIDSADVGRARAEADSVARLWRAGANFESLAARHHDDREERNILQPFERSQLPQSYSKAFEGKKANDITDPFSIEDKQSGVPKFVVAQLLSTTEGGEYTVADLRSQIRDQLQQERSIRRLLDSLRKDIYVSILL